MRDFSVDDMRLFNAALKRPKACLDLRNHAAVNDLGFDHRFHFGFIGVLHERLGIGLIEHHPAQDRKSVV